MMSRANTVKRILPSLAILAMASCASTAGGEKLTDEEQAYQDAIEQALQPATEEQIAQAERSDPITRANFWANEYQKNGADEQITVNFMRALRGIGSHDRVLEIATNALPIHPTSYEIYLELGRSFMALNKPTEAAQAFVRSADFSPATDAAPLAALGLAFDRLESHGQAQDAYELALEREPTRVSTLSNYGLSLALTGDLAKSERLLRQAVEQPDADSRVRQNLALVLGLQGKYDDMISVDPNAPARSVEENQRALRDMMLPARSYQSLQSLDEVLAEAQARPGPEQDMPEIREAQVDAESMTEPNEADLDGAAEATSPTGLRPKLRGSQGG
ncbi:MAG: hypothetical protein AAFY82_05125 [Pseudomonadota bacterium]